MSLISIRQSVLLATELYSNQVVQCNYSGESRGRMQRADPEGGFSGRIQSELAFLREYCTAKSEVARSLVRATTQSKNKAPVSVERLM